MPDHSEDEILSRARLGDREALGSLLREHHDQLTAAARHEIGDGLQARLSANDIVQLTCLSAIRKFGTFKGQSRNEFAGWLRAIQKKKVIDVIRYHVGAQKRALSMERRVVEDSEQSEDLQLTPSRQMILGEMRRELLGAVSRLPEDQGRAVRMRFFERSSLQAIALELDRSEDAAAAVLKRGVASLRRTLNSAGQ